MSISLVRGILLAILAVVILAAGWFSYFEVHYVEEPVTEFTKPVLNPYDLAEKYLESSGVPVKTIGRFEEIKLLDSNGTLIIDDMDKVVGLRQQNQLAKWIESGGHLIVKPSRHIDEDSLLGQLGLRWYEYPEREDDNVDEDATEESDSEQQESQAAQRQDESVEEAIQLMEELVGEESCSCEPTVTTLYFEDLDDPLEIHFNTWKGFVHDAMYIDPDNEESESDESSQALTVDPEPIYWVWDDDGAMFLQFEKGDGLISVVSTMSIWQNERIADVDHAFLLSVLAGDSSAVMVLHHGDVDHLLVMIRKIAPELCITLALLLAFWLWRRASGFGPKRELYSNTRAALNDHLRIEPLQLWRIGKLEKMAEAIKKDIYHQLVLSGYPIATMNDDEINEHIRELTGVDMKTLLEELQSGPISEKRLTDIVKILQQIRRQL